MNTTVRYDIPVLRAAIAAYIKRVYLKHLILPTILGLALLVYAFYETSPWLRAFIVVTVLLIPSVIILGYWMRVRHSLRILSILEDGKVSFSIGDDGLTTSSAIGTSCMAWKVFSEIWDTPKSHLLLYTNHQFVTLPKDQVSPEFIQELQRKIHS
jgi:hypothetical protein